MERPVVDFVKNPVLDFRARVVSPGFLVVRNVVFRDCLHALALDSNDGFVRRLSTEIGICAIAKTIARYQKGPAERVAKGNLPFPSSPHLWVAQLHGTQGPSDASCIERQVTNSQYP